MGKTAQQYSIGDVIFRGVFLVVGILIVAWEIWYACKPMMYSETVKAVVIDEEITEHQTSHKGHITHYTTYESIVEYEYNGWTYTVKSGEPVHADERVKIGNNVFIRIKPDAPDKIMMPRASSQNIGIIGGLVGGIVLICIGFFSMKKALRSRREYREAHEWETE